MMSEHGFFNPTAGRDASGKPCPIYWQTCDEVPPEILAGYPEGTVEVPVKPGANFEFDGASWVEVAPSLDALRSSAKCNVDAAAEAYRLTFITPGSGQSMAYAQKLDEARAYLADRSLTAAGCPHIFAEVGITAQTAEAVAQVVVGMHAAWQAKSAEIERKRLAAKAAIDSAETAEAISRAAVVAWDP